MINKVILIGNVGQEPDIRYTGDTVSGAKVATIRLATTERYKDRNGNLQEHTEWHSVIAWRNTADLVEKYVKKGTQLYIEGRLRTRSWEDQSGNKRYATEIMADTLQLLGRKSDGQNNPQGGYQQNYGQQQGGYQQTQPAYQQQAQQPYQQPAYQQPAPQPAPVQQPAAPQNIEDGDAGNDLPF
ncbi:MAG: single-stranded DNA-binding protein [Bacteroidales bacterium]|nr:single-stranded DNA-binding protein [Bacteroidales bacterium]